MSALVTVDQKGLMGPALTLIFNTNPYQEKELEEITKLLKANFINLAGFKPKGRKEFCSKILKAQASGEAVSKTDMIMTKFFQNMRHQGEENPLHGLVVKDIVPVQLEIFKRQTPSAKVEESEKEVVTEWLASSMESYLTEEQIKSTLASMKFDVNNPEVLKKRVKVEKQLYEKVLSKKLNEENLNELITHLRAVLNKLEFIKDVNIVMHDFANRINDEEGYTPIQHEDETIVQEIVKYVEDHALLEEEDHEKAIPIFFWEYIELFAISTSPKELAKDVLDKLEGPFKAKMFPKTKDVDS